MPRTTPQDVPLRAHYGEGSYRRCIVLEAGPGQVRGELADDFHHFAVTVVHDGARVTGIRGEGIRVPWTTCPGAAMPLERLVGAELVRSLAAVARHTDPRAQCTHWYDAACLAIVHAKRHAEGGAATRRYDLVLPDRRDGQTTPTLHRDGVRVLRWRVAGLRIAEATPDIFAGLSLEGRAFSEFMKSEHAGDPSGEGTRSVESGALDHDLAEAALVMRRGVFIGLGRQYDFEAISHATTFAPVVGAACHTFNDDHIDAARKVVGTVRDFHASPESILER